MFRKVLKWEFLAGKRFYLVFVLYFLTLFSLGSYTQGIQNVEHRTPDEYDIRPLTPGTLIDIVWEASDVWWFSFPVVIAYAVFTFSYELDKKILRTYLLSRVKKRTLFLAKLLSIQLGLFIPLIISLLIVYPLGDPILFGSNPLEVYVNLPRRLLLVASMLYIMVGISALSSTVFKNPLYAFAAPIAIVYTLNIAGLRVVSEYIPPQCYQDIIPDLPIGLLTNEDFFSSLSMALPAVIASTIALIIAYTIFIRRDVL
jgi:hypothetical protein